MDTLAQRLRALRTQRGLNQRDVAQAAGIDRTHLSKIETGVDTPGRAALTSLAAFYGVSIDWLVTGQDTAAGSAAQTHVQTEEEALLLACWRALPRGEAAPLLEMLRERVAGLAPDQEN